MYGCKVAPAEMAAWALRKTRHLTPSSRDFCLCTVIAQCMYFYTSGSSDINKPQASCMKFVCVTYVTYQQFKPHRAVMESAFPVLSLWWYLRYLI
jgi:hypothetical protein